jgi:hypothetical protein
MGLTPFGAEVGEEFNRAQRVRTGFGFFALPHKSYSEEVRTRSD